MIRSSQTFTCKLCARKINGYLSILILNGNRHENGLLYHGRKIRGDKSFRKTLTRGDVFRIGDEHGTLVTLTYNDGSGTPQVTLPTIHPIPLQTATIAIGRLQDNDVVLNHPQVSAHHAQFTPEEGTYRLTDLNSTNHTYVNGLSVTSLLLKPEDEIRIGPFKFIYTGTELTQYDESESIRIDALDLKKWAVTRRCCSMIFLSVFRLAHLLRSLAVPAPASQR